MSSYSWAATLACFSIFLAGQLWLASPAVLDGLTSKSGLQESVLVALWPLAAYIAYAVATGLLAWRLVGIAAVFVLFPVTIAASAHGSEPGAWQDYAAMLSIYALYASLRPLFLYHTLLGGMLPMLYAVNVAAAAFLLVRRLEGIGYSIGWPLSWLGWIVLSFATIAAIDIPLGTAIRFIRYDPAMAHWHEVPFNLLRLFFLTAWPEEFLFRGLLQNLLGKSLRNENFGWILASVVFGLTHIVHGFPNWKYVLLATVAGLFYGLAWRITKSIFPGAAVHTLVDLTWQTLFRTL